MSDADHRAKAIFEQALQQRPEERRQFINNACGKDVALRQRVDAMMRERRPQAEPLLDQSRLNETLDSKEADDQGSTATELEFNESAVASRIGPYELLQQIGEGGMGTVWMARQLEPVRRKVALKLVKSGCDTKSVLARFEQERHALALMDHPNIARVLDGGMSEIGQPYFVMELVNGLPLNTFCDDARLTPRERLELFIPICQAVQHAHQKGIVHRDLKPANILVTTIDGIPVPKIIDFGVAKAIGGNLVDELVATRFGAIVGTLEYMSPEQAGYSGEDIDTRADIYSLGVILYELLTGLRPIDSKQLQKAAITEMIRIIREDEPSKPSTRLSSDDSFPSMAAIRKIEPKRLAAMLRGELDWVVMRCLEKQRDRRYSTANDLANDIRRYLHNEPVEARPPSSVYRINKFLNRHRGPVVAAGLVAFALLAGIAGTTWGLLEAQTQKENAINEAAEKELARQAESERAEGERVAKLDAEKSRDAANLQAQIAKRNEATAQERLTQLEQAIETLAGVFQNLDPNSEEKEGLPLREILAQNLEQTATALHRQTFGDPMSLARLQGILGQAFAGLGSFDSAIRELESSLPTHRERLGPDHADTFKVANALALAYRSVDRFNDAIELLVDTLDHSKAAIGPGHLDTLALMNSLSLVYRSAGMMDKAFPLYVETEAKTREMMGDNDPSTLAATHDLALAWQDLGQMDKALPLLEDTLQKARSSLGDDHTFTLNAMNNLGNAYEKSAQPENALPLMLEALAGRRAKLGPTHPSTLQSMGNLGLFYVQSRRPDKAIPILEETLAGRQARLGANHRSTLGTMQMLAEAYLQDGQTTRSLEMLNATLATMEQALGEDHPDTLNLMNNLAGSYWQTKQFEKSIPLFERLFPIHVRKMGPDHPLTIFVQANLGVNYRDAGRLDEGIATLADAERRMRSLAPVNAARMAWIPVALSIAYERNGQHQKAEPGFRQAWQEAVEGFGEDDLNTAAYATLLADTLLKLSKFSEAQSLLEPALRTRERLAPDDWSTFNTQSLLGSALLGQQQYGEAEPLLIAGFLGLKKHESTIPDASKSRLTESLQSIVDLYEEMLQPDEAAKWREQLSEANAR